MNQKKKYTIKNILIYARARAIGCVREFLFLSKFLFNRFNWLSFFSLTILISVSANAAAPLLTDQNPQKRQQAIINAANGETTNSEIRELERLAMDNTDLTARSLAIQALGQHEHSFELLKSILENQSESMVARQSAASALGMFNQPRALNALADVYETSDGELKEHIGGCLDSMRARFPASVESVLEGEQP